jgi:uncharacterized membrane protein
MRELVEQFVREGVQWLRLLVEVTGALTVALGIGVAGTRFTVALLGRRGAGGGGLANITFTPVRLVLARYLALALEFQLGADILSTAIAPTWTQIGQLGAIAIIRTALNFFLSREMREEQRTTEAELATAADAEALAGTKII